MLAAGGKQSKAERYILPPFGAAVGAQIWARPAPRRVAGSPRACDLWRGGERQGSEFAPRPPKRIHTPRLKEAGRGRGQEALELEETQFSSCSEH